MTKKPIILFLEDDPTLGQGLKGSLSAEGMIVKWVQTISDAKKRLEEGMPDLAILDVALPDGDGIEFCKELHAEFGKRLPILMLTDKKDEKFAVNALSRGAVDYIRKPCGPFETLLKVRKSLSIEKELVLGSLLINFSGREILVGGKKLNLRRREFDIFCVLARSLGDVVTRQGLLDQMRDSEESEDRTLDSHMSRIRSALRKVGAKEIILSSVYGVGYKLEARSDLKKAG